MKKLIKYTPAMVAAAFSIVTLFLYVFTIEHHEVKHYLQMCIAPLVALAVPLLNKVLKIQLPFIFNVAVTFHAVVALDFATALGFYEKWIWLDKFLHFNFGFLGALGVFLFLQYFGGRKLHSACFFIAVFLVVMGLAAMWEVWEFSCDCISVTSNCQVWKPELNSPEMSMTVEEYFRTHNPLEDTMWDMIVTIFGCLVFFASVFIDKLCGYKVCRKIWQQLNAKGEYGKREEEV